MGKASPRRVKWLIIALYMAILVESISLGAFSHAALTDVIDHTNIRVEHRSPSGVIILTLLVVALLGHCLTLPSLCIAVQRHSASALVPYLVWRAILSCIIIVIAIWQLLGDADRPFLLRSAFHGKQVYVFIVEMILGTFFFTTALLAHREFNLMKIDIERTPERDAFQ